MDQESVHTYTHTCTTLIIKAERTQYTVTSTCSYVLFLKQILHSTTTQLEKTRSFQIENEMIEISIKHHCKLEVMSSKSQMIALET